MLHYISRGTIGKPSIIFIHGTSQSAQVWDAVMTPDLSNAYTLIAVDLPGHGQSPRSSKPQQDYTLPGMGSQFAGFMQQFNPGDHIVVATSLGTNIFAEALPYMQHCKGAVLVGCCAIGDALTPADIMQPNPDAAVSFIPHPDNIQLEAYLNVVVRDTTAHTTRQQYKETFLAADSMFRQVVGESVGRGEWNNELQHLRDSHIPLALVYGAQEAVIQKQHLRDVPLNKWQDTIIEIDNAGHSVQIDQPLALAALIKEFAAYCFK